MRRFKKCPSSTTNDVSRILSPKDGYPKDRQFFIIGMMRKFELCFDFPGGKQLLVAELLSPNEPELGLEDEETLRFEYHYEALPEGVLPRFIVRNHHHLTKEPIYWRSGVLLKFDENRVLVREDFQATKIFVSIFDDPQGRRRALAAIRLEFISIHRGMPGLRVEERVSIPGTPGVTAGYDHLLRLEKKGIKEHLFDGAEDLFSVRQLLDGVSEPEVRAMTAPEAERAEVTSNRPLHIENLNIFHDQATMQQLNQSANMDLGQLTTELAQLKAAMHEKATEPEHYAELAEVAKAEAAAKEGKGAKAIEMLKGFGEWGAKLTGEIAGSAIKGYLGM